MGWKRVQAATHPGLWTTSKIPVMLAPMDKPLYPCGHCGVMFPRVQALRQAGYCQRCEFMTRAEVVEYLMVGTHTPLLWSWAGKVRTVKIAHRLLFPRADVEHMGARMRATKRSWSALIAA
jgi:hypothetical protein